MRHLSSTMLLCVFLLCAATPALAQQAAPPAGTVASKADVLEYIRLFGYRQMMEISAQRQLDVVIELVRQSHPDVAPGVLELIHKELQSEIEAATDDAVQEMVPVFQHSLTSDDVAYLLGVGRDPRMQKVVAMQPKIAEDMEAVGERLGENVTQRAAPRIEQRLQQLEHAQPL